MHEITTTICNHLPFKKKMYFTFRMQSGRISFNLKQPFFKPATRMNHCRFEAVFLTFVYSHILPLYIVDPAEIKVLGIKWHNFHGTFVNRTQKMCRYLVDLKLIQRGKKTAAFPCAIPNIVQSKAFLKILCKDLKAYEDCYMYVS